PRRPGAANPTSYESQTATAPLSATSTRAPSSARAVGKRSLLQQQARSKPGLRTISEVQIMARLLSACLARRFGLKADAPSRRQFLRATLAAGAGLLLSCSRRSVNGPGDPARQHARGKRVCVIGAGLSGLACAYELRAAGYDVQ